MFDKYIIVPEGFRNTATDNELRTATNSASGCPTTAGWACRWSNPSTSPSTERLFPPNH